jgi:hypothetical protein
MPPSRSTSSSNRPSRPRSTRQRSTLPHPSATIPISLGVGLIAFDLNDFATAQQRLGQLLTDRKLGTPTVPVEENGQTRITENDQYWEATLKLMKSNLALAAANPSDTKAQAAKTETINYLKQLFIRWGRAIGGPKWSPQFEQMRKELVPDFDPDAMATTLPGGAASEPATNP